MSKFYEFAQLKAASRLIGKIEAQASILVLKILQIIKVYNKILKKILYEVSIKSCLQWQLFKSKILTSHYRHYH